MSLDECCALKALKEEKAATIEDWQEGCNYSFGNVWNGTESIAISHAGGEFTDLAREVLGDFWKINQAFTEQMPVPMNTYLAWSLAKSKGVFKSFFEGLKNDEQESNSNYDEGEWSISVIDVFYTEKVKL
ncbi:uncharacterized protein EDB93DRAFT_1101040 [Suillus bovinus]|uniref:uncharacterized protein n=1 Tax=Suillus bovinus TaxID=48563 RepID=UPI001B88313F|nr:uncharacterized protein EDB93DRAFT_1101040 [Suillus bovinus]KAG2157711.1 hypothetical protein EDB93DRAFT_1101040 [Suillus bovinus]